MTVEAIAPDQKARAVSPTRQAVSVFLRNPSAMAGLILLLLIVLASVFGPMLYTVSPIDIVWRPFTPPGEMPYFLGTDYVGRDIIAGLLHGGRVTLIIGFTAAILTVAIGVTVGALAGFYGGWVDAVLMRVTEFFQVIPYLLIAMVIVMLFGATVTTTALAIGGVSWTGTARLARAEFLRLRELDYVKAERSIGAPDSRLIWRVMLPNAAPPLIVSSTLSIGIAVLFEAGLSYLGLSDPNHISWGRMIGESRPYILDTWWAVTFPGLAIFLSVLAISLVGDGLNDALNPKLRRR